MNEEQLKQVKQDIYKNNLDYLTIRMTRKKAQGTWTEQDETEYNNAYAFCQKIIKDYESQFIIGGNDGEQ